MGSLLHFDGGLFRGYSLLLLLVCCVRLDLFLRRLFVHGLRGFVAHNIFTFRLLVCGLLTRGIFIYPRVIETVSCIADVVNSQMFLSDLTHLRQTRKQINPSKRPAIPKKGRRASIITLGRGPGSLPTNRTDRKSKLPAPAPMSTVVLWRFNEPNG
jgi:hypothetical protein